MLKVLFAGATAGVLSMPTKYQVFADWDVINHSALDFLNQYKLSTIRKVSETSRNQTIKAIDAWIRSGDPLPSLVDRLEPIYGDARAKRIAVTEVTRVYAEGNTMSWQSSGVVKQATFHTSEDEKVCEICSPLDGEVVDVDDYGRKPPLHVLCRCWQTPVVDVDLVGEKVRGILGTPPALAYSVDELMDKFMVIHRLTRQTHVHHH